MVLSGQFRYHIATRTDGRFMVDTEDREISEGLHSDEQGAIYNHPVELSVVQGGCITSKTSSGTRIISQSKGR